MCGQCFATWKNFLSLGFGAPRVKGAIRKVWELPIFTSDLLEGKHSGSKIGREQQKFRNKKLAIKRLQCNWIGNSFKRAWIKWIFLIFSLCEEYFQKVHSKTKIPSFILIFFRPWASNIYIFIYNTPVWTAISWNVKCIFFFLNHTLI